MRYFLALSLAVCALHSSASDTELSADALEDKLGFRRRIISLSPKSRNKEASDLNAPAYFLASDVTGIVSDLRALERYTDVRLNSMMWSAFFWPNYLGGVAFRYQDQSFPTGDWGKSRDYVRSASSVSTSNDLLSPAEKYDIVMGISPEETGSLTTHQWRMGEGEYGRTGLVATWQGICHGWAPASFNLPVPVRSVVFSTRRGNITFTPEDIKALGSLLYANGKYESSYTGVRCNLASPDRDHTGRVRAAECFDINPADWHIITTHHLGMGRRPFVIDIVNSSEVWNKPLIGYKYKYLNLEHNVTMNTMNSALVPIAQARRLRHGAFRSSKAVYVVGISMTITYLDGGFARNNMNNTKEMEFRYDLELDAQYRIVGGEWQSEKHPDFAWKPRFASLPITDGDSQTTLLKPWEAAVNPQWRDAALVSIQKGAPLTKFVKYLFDYSASN